MSNDPVCHIPTNLAQIQPPKQSKLPVIPAANDLPSAIAAINQIRLVLQMITGQSPTQKPGLDVPPNVAVTNNQGINPVNPFGPSIGTPRLGRFTENKTARVVNEVAVTGGKFARVDQVVFEDTVTGELIVWKR